ncbi:Bardet-Biedl syndrome 4 protein homolog isoform X2 [Macrosteles quadrilineatus]|uniref:Bardet-Biedl syndrome 4 protein homolog isoform X2 n=1 Tax=Macrosteles quadrilineatus TaxID=74068 RepID=UPI0023E315A7|nr:Bardet-Biedl syndrome 4 protein homolog isoform X2 [Macrosteles quadrilineatus]
MNHSSLNGSISSGQVGHNLSAVPRPTGTIDKGAEFFSITARNWLIHLRYVRKEFDICKLLIEEELKKTRGYNEYANYVLGLILRHEGKIQESMEYFKKCHTLNPKNIENIKQVARSLFLLGRHELALEAYLEAERTSDSPDWNIYHNLGECFLMLAQLGKAREYLTRAVQLGKSQVSYRTLAQLYEQEGDIQGAIDVYSTALEFFPGNSDLAVELGLIHLRNGDYQRSVNWLGYALAHDSTCTSALLATGAIIQKHEDFDIALAKYKMAAQHRPESAALWNNVGMCFFGKKKYIATISCLKMANYLSPLDWKTLYNLGLVYLTCRQYASSFVSLSACVKLRQRHAPSFMLLALVLMHLEDQDNAGKAWEQAVKLDPEDPGIRANYAAFWVRLGLHQQALDQLNVFNRLAQQVPNIEPQCLFRSWDW